MVELPQYVRCVARRGRRYYFFHKHRGTAAEWPAIPLPEPFDGDFPQRLAICNALEWNGDGLVLAGRPLPPVKDGAFWPEAARAMAIVEAADHQDRKTFRALIATFRAHSVYDGLSKSTRRGYDRDAGRIETAWGNDLVADLTAVDAQEAIDSMGDTPAAANQFRAFLSRLLSFGIPRGFCTQNVAEFTEKMEGSEPWPSWPDWAFETFFAYAPFKLAMPAISALFTGQRQVDVLAMPRPKTADHTIPVRAQKTGAIVWVPIHSEYQRWIEEVPKADAVPLHLNTRGEAYTADGYRTEWQKLMRLELEDGARPFARFREERIVFHGLRKNAVVMLLESGCTESQVGAIVNMSEQMVRHYGRDTRVKILARDGMRLLENRWAELRPTHLPRTRTERELETKG